MELTRRPLPVILVATATATLCCLGGWLILTGFTRYRYPQLLLCCFGGMLLGFSGLLFAHLLKLGKISINTVKHELRAYTLFGREQVLIKKHEVQNFSVRKSQARHTDFHTLIVVLTGETHLIPLLGAKKHLNTIHRFFRKHQHNLALNDIDKQRDTRTFGWVVLLLGLLIAGLATCSLFGNMVPPESRLLPENQEVYSLTVDHYELNYSRYDDLLSIGLKDYGKGDFVFVLPDDFYGEAVLEEIANTLDKGYRVVSVRTNKVLFEEKILNIPHPLNFDEKYWDYQGLAVVQLRVGDRLFGEPEVIAQKAEGSGNIGFLVAGVVLMIIGGSLISYFSEDPQYPPIV